MNDFEILELAEKANFVRHVFSFLSYLYIYEKMSIIRDDKIIYD